MLQLSREHSLETTDIESIKAQVQSRQDLAYDLLEQFTTSKEVWRHVALSGLSPEDYIALSEFLEESPAAEPMRIGKKIVSLFEGELSLTVVYVPKLPRDALLAEH